MQKAYDVHRAVTRQSRRMELHYKGVVDFSGGPYGILKAAVAREIEMERGMVGTGTELLLPGGDLPRMQRKLELKELELNNREMQLTKKEVALERREMGLDKREQALRAGTPGAGGPTTGETLRVAERASQPAEREQAPTGGALRSQVIPKSYILCT